MSMKRTRTYFHDKGAQAQKRFYTTAEFKAPRFKSQFHISIMLDKCAVLDKRAGVVHTNQTRRSKVPVTLAKLKFMDD